MAIVIEYYLSRTTTFGLSDADGEAEFDYRVIECKGPLEARDAVLAEAPAEYQGLARGPMTVSPLGAEMYKVTLKYQVILEKMTVNFDTTCEKIKVMHSKETIANVRTRYTGDQLRAAPDFGGLIGVGKDKIEGVEVYAAGSFKFTVTWTFKYGAIDPSYIMTVMGMGATVNRDPVVFTYKKSQQLYFEKGCLLFIGATFDDADDDGCRIVAKFEGRLGDDQISIGDLDGQIIVIASADTSATLTQLTNIAGGTESLRAGMLISGPGVPPGTTIQLVSAGGNEVEMSNAATSSNTALYTIRNSYLPYKEGHWYVWLRSISNPDRTNGVQVEVPDSAHIERVYDYEDFTKLEIFDVITSQEDTLDQEEEEELEEEQAEQGFLPLPDDFGSTFPVRE